MSDLHRARRAPTTALFCESQQDIKQVEDPLRSEDAMDAPSRLEELEVQGCVMLPAMAQAHSSCVGAGAQRRGHGMRVSKSVGHDTHVQRDSRVVETGFGEVVSPREGARAHPPVTLHRHHRADPPTPRRSLLRFVT